MPRSIADPAFGAVFLITAMVTASCAGPDLAAQGRPAPGLTAARALSRVYDAILDARFEALPALTASACAPSRGPVPDDRAPAEACRVLDAVAEWWAIKLDVFDTTRDGTFTAKADAAIAAAEAWVAREPSRAEAWFYLGAGYATRAQWRSTRGQSLSAARDGKRIKEAMERAVGLAPALEDARFGVGLYQYYADVAPAALRLLRWMLLLPGGDRVAGLRAMEQSRARAQVVRSEAEYQLLLVYLWYEHDPDKALALAAGLRGKHPHNPHFAEIEADIHDVHRSDVMGAFLTWQALWVAASRGEVARPEASAARARIGMAVARDRLGDTDRALDDLRAVVQSTPASPVGVGALAHLELGAALDHVGLRSEALTHYKAALAINPPSDPWHVAARARNAMRVPPNEQTAMAYRRSLEGWRALERGALGEATRLLAQSTNLRPADPMTRYRLARLSLAEQRATEAIDELELIIKDPATPPHVFSAACHAAARALEQRGGRDRALELYRLVVDAFGVDPSLKADAQRSVSRLMP